MCLSKIISHGQLYFHIFMCQYPVSRWSLEKIILLVNSQVFEDICLHGTNI